MELSEINKMVDTYIDSLNEGAYQDYFKSVLKKWNVKSPNQLSPEKKVEFFKDVKKGWSKSKKS